MTTASEKTNTLAIVSLILAFFVPLVGAILGHVALGQIKKTGEQGRGIALAGVIIGWVFTALSILGAILFFVPFFVLGVDVLGGM
jgi:Sec-independent protein secretion pathway component TatC